MLINIVLALFLVGGALLVLSGMWLLKRSRSKQSNSASLLYSLTHDELSNPIQSALAALTNLERRIPTNAHEQRQDAASLRQSLNRLTDVTRNLRALAMIETPDVQRVRERVNLAAVSQSLVMELGEIAEASGVRLAYEGGDEPVFVLAQKVDLQRVLTNIIDNGIKYSRSVPQASVLVSLTPTRQHARIVVTDNGVGMTCERLKTVGSLPQRPTARTVGTTGAGLGLYLVKQIVDHYHGKLSIDSVEGRGTTVTLDFPIAR
jgi:two-component system phosphate regulon sensor histidine kinase PhoR